MSTEDIIIAIDQQIAILQQTRSLLVEVQTPQTTVKRGRGRPKGAKRIPSPAGKRTMSAEGRARIAAAQKARWAAKRS